MSEAGGWAEGLEGKTAVFMTVTRTHETQGTVFVVEREFYILTLTILRHIEIGLNFLAAAAGLGSLKRET